jgi:hypothetical protein
MLALPPNVYSLLASFLQHRDARALSFTCKHLHCEIAPILRHYHLPHDVAVALGESIAKKYRWTLRIQPNSLFFSGRNAYDVINVLHDSREIRFNWWYGSVRHCCLNKVMATVDDELNGELIVMNRHDYTRSTTRYTDGLLAALRDADVHV